MSRSTKVILIVFGIIAAIYIAARLTGVVGFYTISSKANSPTINPGDILITSNLKQPEIFDFIFFKAQTEQYGQQLWVMRLCGKEGDVVEIKGGEAFVNGKSIDIGLELNFSHLASSAEYGKVSDLMSEEEMFVMDSGQVFFFISDRKAKARNLYSSKMLDNPGKPDEQISKVHGGNWNRDYFGPVEVPKGQFFVLGDNRHNSLDSRYTGFINKSDYVGTMTGKLFSAAN